MLSHLKSYLFGGTAPEEEAVANENPCNSVEEDEWVLVDSKDVITELPGNGDDVNLQNELEESWIVTQELGTMSVSTKLRHRTRQPKGTKPRRLRASKKLAPISCPIVNDNDSITSSIAIIPSPEHRAASASSSPVLNASLSDAKQVAAIRSSQVKQKAEKSWLSRRHLLQGNKTVMAASGRNTNRRCHHIAKRMCGSNNNRKTHFSKKQ